MPFLRETPTPDVVSITDRLQRDQHQRDVIDRRLGQLEADRAELLKGASACRRAAEHLPAGRDREVLTCRADALGRDFASFRTMVELRDTATA